MTQRRPWGILVFLLLANYGRAQVGGSAVYGFLDVPAAARAAALGGTFISVKDNDLNSAMQNPALLNPSMVKQLAFSAVSFYDKIKFGDAAYGYSIGKLGTFHTAIHFAHYGEFIETNEAGEATGTFRAADYALVTGYARDLNPRISIGTNLKLIYSDYYL